MNRKNHLAAVLLAAALVFSACNKPANDPQTADSDTASVTPEITETAPTPATPDIPVITEPQTESVQTEPVAVPDETEPPPEITEPLPELPAEIPTEDTTAVETEPTEATFFLPRIQSVRHTSSYFPETLPASFGNIE